MDEFIQWTNDCARELTKESGEAGEASEAREWGEAGEWRQPTAVSVSHVGNPGQSAVCPECGQCVQNAGVVVRNNSGDEGDMRVWYGQGRQVWVWPRRRSRRVRQRQVSECE
jgi:hypothetical protein